MKILLHATLKPAFHNIIIFKKHIMITIELSRSLVLTIVSITARVLFYKSLQEVVKLVVLEVYSNFRWRAWTANRLVMHAIVYCVL